MAELFAMLDPASRAFFQTYMDCAVAGILVPSESEIIDILQDLLDQRYVLAWRIRDFGGPEEALPHASDSFQSPELAFFSLTEEGRRRAKTFQKIRRSEATRDIRTRAWHDYLSSRADKLAFHPRVPTYVPIDIDSIPIAFVDGALGQVQLSYAPASDDFTMPRLVIQEGSGPLHPFQVDSPEKTQVETIGGARISTAFYHVAANWPAVLCEWTSRGVHFRLLSQWKAENRVTFTIEEKDYQETLSVIHSMLDEGR